MTDTDRGPFGYIHWTEGLGYNYRLLQSVTRRDVVQIKEARCKVQVLVYRTYHHNQSSTPGEECCPHDLVLLLQHTPTHPLPSCLGKAQDDGSPIITGHALLGV